MFLASSFCTDTTDLWRFVGECVLIFKIVIPVILVVLGIIGLGKAVIVDDDKEVKTQVYRLIRKIIIAVCIFFVPTLVKGVISIASGWDDNENDWMKCVDCVADPGNC